MAGPVSRIDSKYLAAGGQRLSRTLFVEYAQYGEKPPLYTLAREDREVDGVVYPSLYRLYMEMGDIGEATFAKTYFYDLKQWLMIANSKMFGDEVALWRSELKQRKISEAIEELERDAFNEDSKSSASSLKFLIQNVYGMEPPKKVGRPKRNQTTNGKDPLPTEDEDYLRVLGEAGKRGD